MGKESQLWWMLITTRQDGEGVIAKYTYDNLNKWENEGVFFKNDLGNDSNLEYQSLVHFDGKWYLAFSDQWDQRVVHYCIANDVNGPFEAPKKGIDHIDGAGFYAGRLETDGENLYMVG
ncbi:glycoside hydrolase family protein [Alkalibacterium sp. s-m-22]